MRVADFGAEDDQKVRMNRIAHILFFGALLLTIVWQVAMSPALFTYHHGFVSADVSIAARTFARSGILPLGGVPVNNNSPVSKEDAYTHWPPLLPIVLSWVFRVLGPSEVSAHLLMLFIQILTAGLIYLTGRDFLGSVGAALSGFFWLTLPVVIHFGHLVVQQALCVLFVAATVWLTPRRRLAAACCAFLAVASSWEALLMIPGFLLVAMRRRDCRPAALLVCCAAAIAAAAVSLLYGLRDPGLFADTFQTALFRMGLSHSYSHSMLPHIIEPYAPFGQIVSTVLLNHLKMLGIFGFASLVLLLFSPPKGMLLFLAPLACPWLFWTVLMSNHVAAHDFEMLLAAPAAAIALAWTATRVRKASVAIALLILTLAQPRILGTTGIDVPPDTLLGFAHDLRASTPSGSVIISPLISVVPVWYSDRHVVRNISDEESLQVVLPVVKKRFPDSPIYLAAPRELAGSFRKRSERSAIDRLVLYDLTH